MPVTADTAARAAEVRLLLLAATVVLALAGTAVAAQVAVNSKCPVLPDEDIDPTITLEWAGRTVAFCCTKCQRKFGQDPMTYALALRAPTAAAGAAPMTSAAVQTPPGEPGEHAHNHGRMQSDSVSAEDGLGSRAFALAGNVHVILVHFPIALLCAAALAELLTLRRRTGVAESTHFCLTLAAITACLAAASGWLRAERHVPVMSDVLERHRWLGLGTTAVAVGCALVAWKATRHPGRPTPVLLARLLLLAAVVVVVVTAHHGGMLVYGPEFPFGD